MSKCGCKNPGSSKDKQDGCTQSQDKECCGNTKDHTCKNTKKKQSREKSRDYFDPCLSPWIVYTQDVFILEDLLFFVTIFIWDQHLTDNTFGWF